MFTNLVDEQTSSHFFVVIAKDNRGEQAMSDYNQKEQFLSRREAARYIFRHASTLDKWRAERINLPFYRDGKKVLYAVSDLDRYLLSKRVEPIATLSKRLIDGGA